MRDLNGYLKKILLLFSLVSLISFLCISKVSAAELFTVNSDFVHNIAETSISTEAILTISSTSPRVISYYTATIPEENLKVKCYNYNTNKEYSCTSHNRTGATDVLLDLKNSVVRSNAPLKLRLIYTTATSGTDSFNIPSSIQDITTKSITVTYPKTLGEPLWTSDTVQSIKSIGDNLQITILKPIRSKLSILFGNQISYKFEVSKSFTNSLENENQTFELILPADGPNQTIVWDKIDPLPNIAQKDEDGNYIFQYTLPPQKTTDCTIKGYILKHNTSEDDSVLDTFLTQNNGYWSITQKNEFIRVDNYLRENKLTIPEGFSNILDVPKDTQELVYKYLYLYVVNRLNPQKALTNGIISDSRVGFDNLVSNPNEATPSDYTDFLITIFRKYNIPAKQVIGYVSNISGYTSDGFYNYWIEVYDYTQNKWITMDPFLEDYSSKSLYKDNFYDHISILMRGKSSVAPKLTFYNDNDFKVTSSSQENIIPNFSVTAQLVFDSNDILSKYFKTLININNDGNIAVSAYKISQSSFENLQKYVDPVNNINTQIVLPKQNATLQFNILNSGSYSNSYVNVVFSNMEYKKEVLLESNLDIFIPVYMQIFVKILSVGLFLGLGYLVYFLIKRFRHKHNG